MVIVNRTPSERVCCCSLGFWFSLVLWHINHYRLFNTKSCLYIYIKYIICKHILLITSFNVLELIFCTQLNSFKYFYQTQIILFAISSFVCTQLNVTNYCYLSNNSIKHWSFVYTQLNDQTVLFLTILLSISHLFPQSLNVKQFYLTHR